MSNETSSNSFFPEPEQPYRCACGKPATWLVYNKKIVQEQYHCDACVPPEGTPRIKRRSHSPRGFWYTPAPPPGTIN